MTLRAIIWIVSAFIILAIPFAVLLSGERAPSRSFLWDFSMGLGFGALAMTGFQFILTARFRKLAMPFGMDILYQFHRYLALGAFVIMLSHFAIIYIWYKPELGVLNPLEARWELTSGRIAMGCFLALIISSEFRTRLKLQYEWWRYIHIFLAVVGFSAALAHVLGVGNHTGTAGKLALWIGVTVGWFGLLVWVRMIKPYFLFHNPWTVVDNIKQHGDVHSIVFKPEKRGLKKWKPGQFVWLSMKHSPYAMREHPFTITNAPEQGPNVMISIKPLGDFTSEVVHCQIGEKAYIDGPYGVFSIDSHAKSKGFIMVAGGVGITPIISNLHAMEARKDKRKVILFYCNNTWDDAAFRDELAELEEKINLKVIHVLNEPDKGWKGESGYLNKNILKKHLRGIDLTDYACLLCGPEPLTDGARADLIDLGLHLHQIENEIFNMV